MNLLLIGSDDMSSETLELLHEAFNASIFLSGSLEEALSLARTCAFRYIVMAVRGNRELDGLRTLVQLQPGASILVYQSTLSHSDLGDVVGNITWLRSLEELLVHHHKTQTRS